MMKIFDVMLDCGTHRRLDRTNDKLDVLIEGQKETNTILREGSKEILEKINVQYPNGVAHA